MDGAKVERADHGVRRLTVIADSGCDPEGDAHIEGKTIALQVIEPESGAVLLLLTSKVDGGSRRELAIFDLLLQHMRENVLPRLYPIREANN